MGNWDAAGHVVSLQLLAVAPWSELGHRVPEALKARKVGLSLYVPRLDGQSSGVGLDAAELR